MRKRRIIAWALVILLAGVALPGRASDEKDNINDIGKRRVAHRSIISEEKEIAIGKQYASEIDKSAKIITDPVINEYVNRVAQNIARNSDLKIPLTVKVIDSPGINAFALPGGSTIPILAFLVCLALIASTSMENLIAGLAALALGAVIYLFRRKPSSQTAPPLEV